MTQVREDALARLQHAVDTAFNDDLLAAVVQKIRVLAVDAADDVFLAAGNDCAAQVCVDMYNIDVYTYIYTYVQIYICV